MTLPDVSVSIAESSAPQFAPPSTANLFCAGLAERGPANEPTLVQSVGGFSSAARFGERQADSPLYDSLDVFFREIGQGGGNAYVSRIVGPAAAAATEGLVDQVPADTLTVTAVSVGAWGNDIDVTVTIGGGNFVIHVLEDGEEVEVSPELADSTEAVAWAESSNYIRLTDLGGAGDPVAQTISLVGGTDDRANVTQTEIDAALAAFTADFGPGQMALFGFTNAEAHEALLVQADLTKRVALLDGEDTASRATLVSAAQALRTVSGHRLSGMFAPWDVVPGIVSGTTRTVPPSARNAALYARSLAEGGSAGDPAAGASLPARYVTGLSQPAWHDDDREALNDGGVNVSRVIRGQVLTYGNRTLTSAITEPNWAQLAQSRVITAIASEGAEIGARYVHSKVDGRGFNVGRFVGELEALCLRLLAAGDLYGESPADAFVITPATDIEDGSATVLATIEARVSPGADRVEIEVVKVPVV